MSRGVEPMLSNRRQSDRIHFELGYMARMIAIDATWQRQCSILDISQTGARLMVDGSLDGLSIDEFFLVLSRTGNSHRRCKLAWVKGDEIGAKFLQQMAQPKDRSRRMRLSPADDPSAPLR